jgi:hypothetical protein
MQAVTAASYPYYSISVAILDHCDEIATFGRDPALTCRIFDAFFQH